MKRNTIIAILVTLVLAAIMINSFLEQGKSDKQYVEELTEHRRKKNIDFQTGEDSPFANDYSKFTGLKYYPPNLEFKVRAKFISIENKKIRNFATSDGKSKQYLEYGYVAFDIKGTAQQLLILEMVGSEEFEGSLFLPFGDETSSVDTYGAGRYIEIEHDGSKFITLDFNYAYNPYCAYSAGYSCPLPPQENLLNVAIEAGEKNYE